ncbi:MAG: ATPase associated with various cellular, 5, partial [Mycobacterium sp.]|nr:ATPase associated with various cellular, 5 [Mycobacterium sp.]
VVKYDKDVRKALDALPRLVDPNAKVPAALHSHSHNGAGHPHSHDHDHDHHHDDAPEPDGKQVRRAKDTPGRFKDGYYGTPKTTAPSARRRPF